MENPTGRSRSTWIGRLSASLIEVAFPPVCGNCRRLGNLICETCRAAMAPVPWPICARCGRGLPDEWLPCPFCAHRTMRLRQARATLLYAEPTSTLIHQMKYEGYFALAGPLGRMMAEGWPAWSTPIDLILPIPLHTRRERQRGYNQSMELARHLAAGVGVPVDGQALRRTRHTRPQVELNPEERHENVRGAFMADEQRVGGRHVLLIDDVFTTGATMTAAAEALLSVGAASVSAYCLSRVH